MQMPPQYKTVFSDYFQKNDYFATIIHSMKIKKGMNSITEFEIPLPQNEENSDFLIALQRESPTFVWSPYDSDEVAPALLDLLKQRAYNHRKLSQIFLHKKIK
jgi:hypothetical protein